jgi:hypothetical protein
MAESNMRIVIQPCHASLAGGLLNLAAHAFANSFSSFEFVGSE